MKIDLNKKGFTLIELLIVIAIIAILAAIAIPQFSAYRIKANNASSLSDLKNTVSAENSQWAEVTAYGSTDGGIAPAPGNFLTDAPAAAAGALYAGPYSPAVGGAAPVAGARIAGINDAALQRATPIGIGNRNVIRAGCSVSAGGGFNSFVVISRHNDGDTAFGADSDNSASMYRVTNPNWAGNVAMMNTLATGWIAAVAGADGFGPNNTVPGGGSPTVNWTVM